VKRSGFERPRYVTAPPAPPRPISRHVVWEMSSNQVRSAPKSPVLVHEVYRRLVRQLPCARCGYAGATQFCHADQGKGMSFKTDDRSGWAGCGPHDGWAGCHHLVGSSGHYPKERRRVLEEIYARWTREQIRDAGAWPIDLPQWPE
jgi:hypothetical protein